MGLLMIMGLSFFDIDENAIKSYCSVHAYFPFFVHFYIDINKSTTTTKQNSWQVNIIVEKAPAI